MPLTDTKIRGARPQAKPYKLADGDGLTLLVNPNGSKWWRLRYRFGGREKILSVGVYPDVPLKHARDKRDSIRKMIASGVDPSVKREAEKKAQADTFAAIAAEWVELQRQGLRAATPRKGGMDDQRSAESVHRKPANSCNHGARDLGGVASA